MKILPAIMAIMVMGAHYTIADTIYFKNGKCYPCKVVGFSAGVFIVEMNGKTNHAPSVNVERIEFSDSATATSPVAPMVARKNPTSGNHTVASYLKEITFGDAADSCSVDQLVANIFKHETKPIKLAVSYRGSIEQMEINSYRVNLYGEEGGRITTYFTEDGLKFITAISSEKDYGNNPKVFYLFGVPLGEKAMGVFKKEYSTFVNQISIVREMSFLPLGRSMQKSRGPMPAAYSW